MGFLKVVPKLGLGGLGRVEGEGGEEIPGRGKSKIKG